MSNAKFKFCVAICGGGIGGVAAAVALSRHPDIDVNIYEATSEFSEVGAGIGVWPRVWKLLTELGLDRDLAKITNTKPTYDKVDTFTFRKSDQAQGLDFYNLQTEGSFIRYHRADFLQVLVDHLPASCGISFSKRLKSYIQHSSGKIDLLFEDGTTAKCDILIGADGIKSAVRRNMLTNKARKAAEAGKLEESVQLMNSIEPRWTGIAAYRALIPTERLQAYRDTHPDLNVTIPEMNSIPTMYMGQHINAVVYPISSGKLINIGLFHAKEELAGSTFPGPWVESVDTDEILAAHNHWEPQLQAIIECIHRPSRWAIHEAQPLQSWADGNVALLGDSAHAMSPQQASGAGQAVEDAMILATLLGHHLTTSRNIAQVLSIYDQIRRPFAERVAEKSIINGQYFGLQLDGIDFDRNPERLPEIGDAIKKNWSWSWATTLDGAMEEAIQRLENTSSSRASL
ncbi:hypothetical protein BD779DRAFT_1672449 [Infundibulicybe gibba]|nr:hypothetical protein BD779DRAFT_1672449 [Infundibulicybe gibba]